MRRISAWFSFSLCVGALGGAAQTARLVFLSTQLPLIEETQEFRNLILKGFSRDIDYLAELPQQFPVHIKAELQGSTRTIDPAR
jgi:hypothetical protein